MSVNEVKCLDINEFKTLWECITIIESQDMLKWLSCFDWPNMTKDQRSRLHKDLYKKAYPDIFKEKKELTPNLLASLMRG